ncbi:MAG TPA: CDP-alcohol phosphatidyltransferase family protein [bacterium]|nr:CDP-alcohol phosphatidyltransferase family protein [bacterium]HOX86104.1 CDP-alcohol phosphatidyltransferase family protein [bacterium]HPG45682.1 CDP-alcohol phosphatidyltransferase family protein [bacterium]HPM97539.1 CDP-alcohol phosphatidyltransferase family protein [bacterium]
MIVKVRELGTLPNLISLSRLIMVIPAAYLIKINTESGNRLLLLLAVLIILSDFIDGYLSRRMGLVTDLGKLLDPVVDKVCMFIGLLSLIFYRGFPASLAVFLVYRDLLIIIIGFIIIRKSQQAIMANFWGKLNTLLVSLTMFLFMIGVDNGVFKICLIGSHFTILASGLSYYAFAESVLFEQRNCINGFRITMFLLTISVIFLALRI